MAQDKEAKPKNHHHAKNDEDDKKPIVDVAEPGKSAPPETSKPVLVGNRPLLKDPMVKDDDQKDEAAAETKPADKQTLSSSSKVKLQPTDPSLKPEEADDKPTILTEAEAETAKKENETKPEDAPGADEAKPADKPTKKAAAEAAAAEARLKHQATIEKLVDSRQYALPIRVPEERRNKRALIIGGIVAVVLILVWVNIALDAGIISLGGLQPVTHFFSN